MDSTIRFHRFWVVKRFPGCWHRAEQWQVSEEVIEQDRHQVEPSASWSSAQWSWSLSVSCFPQKAHAATHTESEQGVWTGGEVVWINCNAARTKPRAGVNVRMEVVSGVTDGYCDRVQVLMEITTGGPTVVQVIEDTSISQLTLASLRLSCTETQLKCHWGKWTSPQGTS